MNLRTPIHAKINSSRIYSLYSPQNTLKFCTSHLMCTYKRYDSLLSVLVCAYFANGILNMQTFFQWQLPRAKGYHVNRLQIYALQGINPVCIHSTEVQPRFSCVYIYIQGTEVLLHRYINVHNVSLSRDALNYYWLCRNYFILLRSQGPQIRLQFRLDQINASQALFGTFLF